MKTLKRGTKIRLFLAVLVAFVLMDLSLRTQWVERPTARLLERVISLATGERAVVGDVQISAASGRVELSGLVLSHVFPSGETSPIVAVERIAIGLGLPWDGAFIRILEVDRPVVSLHLDDDGLREFRNMNAQSSGDQLPWRRIRVNNARVELAGAAGKVVMDGVFLETTKRDAVDIRVESARLKVGDLDENANAIELIDVRVSPKGLHIADFRVESQHTHSQGSLDMVFGGSLKGQATVSVAMPIFDSFVSSARRFEGTAHAEIELLGTVRDPAAKATVVLENLVHHNTTRPERPQRMDLERMVAEIELRGRHLSIPSVNLTWAKGTVAMQADVDLVSRGISLKVGLDGIDLRAAIREAGGHRNSWTTLDLDGQIQVGGTLSPFRLVGSYELEADGLDVGSGPPGGANTRQILGLPNLKLSGAIDTDRNGVWLRSRHLLAGATTGMIDSFIGYTSTGPLDIRFDLDHTSLSTFRPLNNLNLWGFGRVSGTVRGPFKKVKIAASGQVRDFQMVGLKLADTADISFVCDDLRTLDFHHFNGKLGATSFLGSGMVKISANTTMDIDIQVDDARVGDLIGIGGVALPWVDGRLSGNLRIFGEPSALDGEIDAHIRDAIILGESFPAGHFRGWLDKGVVRIDELGLNRWNGEESLFVRGSVTLDWLANLEVTGTGFRVERLDRLGRMNLPLSGDLMLDAVVKGRLMNPAPHGRLALRNTVYAGHAVPDSTIDFHTESESDAGGIVLEGEVLNQGLVFNGWVQQDSTFDLDATLVDFPVHTLFPIGVDGSEVSALASGEVHLTGDLDGRNPFVDLVGVGSSFSLAWDRHTLSSVGPWGFASTGRQMQLEGLHLVGGGTDFSLAMLSDDHGQLSGLGGGIVDADLARMVVPGLTRADGSVGVHVSVGGSIKQPQWNVDAALASVTVQGDWFPHAIEGIQGVVSMNAQGTRFRNIDLDGLDKLWAERDPYLAAGHLTRSRFDGLVGQIGSGKVKITGGWKSSAWRPTAFSIAGTLVNGRLKYLNDFPPVTGDATLTLDGPVDELVLAGRVDVDEMIFSERISWEDSLFQPSVDGVVGLSLDEDEALFSMDIDLVSDNTIRVRNNLADLVAGGALKVVGDTHHPGLVGNIRSISGGTVYIKEREFEVERAELHFSDPFSFDPDVDLLLATDIRTRDEDYAVNYRVSGTYSDWRAETRSEPSLPSADVNALLLFGMTRAELERYGGLGSALALEGGDILASSVLFSGLDDEDRGGLFRIVDPLRPERLDLVSGVSERGSGIVTSELRLLYENELSDVGLPGTLMIFEQNISRSSDTYLGIEQRLARTLYARTYWGSEQVGRYLDLGGAYGFDVKIRWELD